MNFKFLNKYDQAKYNYVLATQFLSGMLQNDSFWDEIPDDKNFDFTNVKTPTLKSEMKNFFQTRGVVFSFYRSSWFYRKVVANVTKNNPLRININTRHFDFLKLNNESLIADLADKIETLSHECVHLADNLNSAIDYGHGSNSSNGKDHSFPYWFGRYCKDFFLINAEKFKIVS